MSDLKFSVDAIKAARQAAGIHGLAAYDAICDAALAHDAERLARQIIEQRVAAIDDVDFGCDLQFARDGAERKAAVLRALTTPDHSVQGETKP